MNLPSAAAFPYIFLLITAILIALIVARPSIASNREGKMLAFAAFLVLPILCMARGTSEHIDRSNQTAFCLSCYLVEPYGMSL
ncbi:MAG: hypothetical protein WBP79_05470 [Candidatus Acidiferrales bacterium]